MERTPQYRRGRYRRERWHDGRAIARAPSAYWTVSVTVKDSTVFPEAEAEMWTVEVPAGVTGVGGGGVLAAELPPPHPTIRIIPASKASNTTREQLRDQILRLLPARTMVNNPGDQNTTESRVIEGPDLRSSAALPAVWIVTTVFCGALVPPSVSVDGWKLQVAFCGRLAQENCSVPE